MEICQSAINQFLRYFIRINRRHSLLFFCKSAKCKCAAISYQLIKGFGCISHTTKVDSNLFDILRLGTAQKSVPWWSKAIFDCWWKLIMGFHIEFYLAKRHINTCTLSLTTHDEKFIPRFCGIPSKELPWGSSILGPLPHDTLNLSCRVWILSCRFMILSCWKHVVY